MAGFFSEEVVEQVRAASDIVDVIGGALPLKRAGANFVGLCPFHQEKTPSFSVNPRLQIFHCFGCHKGGDVFRFIQDYEGLGFGEALQRLAERAHIPIERTLSEGQRQSQGLKQSLLHVHQEVAKRWQAALQGEASGARARDYLNQPGVSPEAVERFRLGYAPDLWDDTVNWAKTKGLNPTLMEQAGLIIRKDQSDHYYDRFRGRLIFPISDDQGRVIGFSGRILTSDVQAAKYVNSPETLIFSKSRVFFGLDKAKRAMLDQGRAVICEGQLDLIACHLAGFENVVAPQGTAFTAEHARILKRYVEEVIVCFDADSAGQQAAIRAHDSLFSSGIAVRVAVLPGKHDPDSFIREQGPEAFRALLDGSREFFEFYLDHLCTVRDPATDRGQMGIVREMASMLRKTGDSVMIDKYAQKTGMKLAAHTGFSISPQAVRTEFSKARPSTYREPASEIPEETPADPPIERPSAQEFWLLRLLLLDAEKLEWATRHLDLDWVQSGVVRQILTERLKNGTPGATHLSALLSQFPETAVQSLITEAVSERREIPNQLQQVQDLVERLRNQFIDRQLGQLSQKMTSPELTDEDRVQLLTRQQELRRLKDSPLPRAPEPTPGSPDSEANNPPTTPR